jgi:hypothetical protein
LILRILRIRFIRIVTSRIIQRVTVIAIGIVIGIFAGIWVIVRVRSLGCIGIRDLTQSGY